LTRYDGGAADGPAGGGLTLVGAPLEVTRTADPRFVDQARANFAEYVHRTLQASMGVGGRYNAPGAFGALYCASDEATAWAEVAARYRREGIPGLPPAMGVLRLLITDGRYADLTDPDVVAAWGFDAAALHADAPSDAQRAECHRVGAAVRAVADFLTAPSARAGGQNVPLFPDREGGELLMRLQQARAATPPPHLQQRSREAW
jgi:RES domain-containing protein